MKICTECNKQIPDANDLCTVHWAIMFNNTELRIKYYAAKKPKSISLRAMNAMRKARNINA